MTSQNGSAVATLRRAAAQQVATEHSVTIPDYDRERLEDVGFITAMTLVLLGNYAQTGHFGGPLAYTPYNVALHLGGPENGGLRYDYRRPKHPFCDRFMLAGGHNIPTAYALWMIMGEAMARKHAATGDDQYAVDPNIGMLAIDALGFRRGREALATLLEDNGLADHPLFAQSKIRGIRALAGHAETTDLTNDVNGGPSGIGVATAAGKAAFWDFVGADDSLKVIALEGEFAMTEGHAQELKTQALAQKVGKRLRILLSYNNAGIDDSLVGGVIGEDVAEGYVIEDQWTSYGWNVLSLDDGNDYDQVMAALKMMEDWDPNDRRPLIVVGKTTKGWWPSAQDGQIAGFGEQLVGYHSHPYEMKMNEPYFVALAETFEQRFGVEFDGIREGPVTDERERLIQFKTNIDVAMSVLNQNGLGDWLANRLVEIGDSLNDELPLRIDTRSNPFQDERLRPQNIPLEPMSVEVTNEASGETKSVDIALAKKPGEVAGTRRAISELIKWVNYVTDNRFITLAADLSSSINVESGALWGHYDPAGNPLGTRIKAPIEEAGNASSAIGFVSQSASMDPGHARWRLGAERHVRRIHTADVPAGPRLESAEPGQPVPRGRAAHPGRALRAGDGGGRADALRHLRAAGMEAVPARSGDQPEFLGLQRRGAGLLRGGGNRGARPEGGRDHDRGCAAGLPGGRPEHVCRLGPAGRAQGFVPDPRLGSGPARAGHGVRAGVQLDGEPGERAAAAGRGRGECAGRGRGERGSVRAPAGGLPRAHRAGFRALRRNGGLHGHTAFPASERPWSADRRVLALVGLGRSVADRRNGAGRNRGGAPGRGVYFCRHQAVCRGA